MSSESSDSFLNWEDHKAILRNRCGILIDEYLKFREIEIEVPRVALKELVSSLTGLFDDRMKYHDLLIEDESRDEPQKTLIGSAVKDLSGILDCLAAEIRKPSVRRKLSYGYEDTDDDQ